MSPSSETPMWVTCSLNGTPISLELDTGAVISTLSYSDSIHAGANITATTQRARAYNGQYISFLGETTIKVFYNKESFFHKFYIVPDSQRSLLGRDLMNKCNIAIKFPDEVNNVSSISNDVLSHFDDYLDKKFQSNVQTTVHLDILDDAKPKFMKARSVPLKLQDKVEMELKRLEDRGTISKIYQSKWASPIVCVLKKNNEIRICADYSSTVNKYLDPVQTPLPTIDQVIQKVGKASTFSQIDLKEAFLQLPLDSASKLLTAINTPYGLYVYNYLPFGLTASPGIFQAYISQILDNIPDVICYQDDILIMSSNPTSHKSTLHKVLSTLRDHGLQINVNKSQFFIPEVKYLGYIFNKDGVFTDENKIKAILGAPSPTSVKQLQSFIGLCTYYQRFIPNFSDVLSPLYKLLKKDAPYIWGSEQQRSFNRIKQLFNTCNILKMFDPNLPVLVETDSSSYGIAGVLLQRNIDSKFWHPVQFISRTLNSAERNYSCLEREALSVVFALDKFKHFLLGSKFLIHNDHKPLMSLFAKYKPVPQSCSARVQRWCLKMAQYNYDFVYTRGLDNVQSDCLSRLPLQEIPKIEEPEELIFHVNIVDNQVISCQTIKEHTDADANLTELKQYIVQGSPRKITNPVLCKFKSIIPSLSILDGCIMYNSRVFIPGSLRKHVLKLFHKEHPGITAMKKLVRSLIWYPGLDSDVESIVSTCNICQSVRSKPSQNVYVTWPEPERPWCRVHIDHCFVENKILLVVIDAKTKYLEVEVVPSVSAHDTMDALTLIFSRHGLPNTLVSDNATSFSAQIFKDFIAKNNIEHVTPPPFSPQSNGLAERAVRVVKDLLKKSNDSKDSLKIRLARILLYYRTVPHATTAISPCVALNKRKYVTVQDKINPLYASKHKTNNICSRKITQFSVGSSVLAYNYGRGDKWLKAIVVRQTGVNTYDVLVEALDTGWKRHKSQLISASPKLQLNQNVNFEPHVAPQVRRSPRNV